MIIDLTISNIIVQPELNAAQITITPTFSSGGGGVGGGHIIQSETETLAQQPKLKFLGATVTNVGDATVVEGLKGKTAYQSALDGGYVGSELQFNTDLKDVSTKEPTITKSIGLLSWTGSAWAWITTTFQNAANKVTSWSATTLDENYPSEKLVKDSLDLKQTVFTGICQEQFLTENDIVIDNTALTLTIATVKNGQPISAINPICFYTDGSGISTRHVKNAPVVFTFTNTNGVWYFYFDDSGNPIVSQTPWSYLATIATVFRFYWNSTLAVADRCVIQAVEFHKNDISWTDHSWKHSQGTQYVSGFDISSNKLASGAPNADGRNSVILLSSGTNIDDNLSYTVTNAQTGTAKFTQDLGTALLPATSAKLICISNDAGGLLSKIPATSYPFLFNAISNLPEYLTVAGVRTPVASGRFFVYYIYALQDPRVGETIKIKSAETDFTNVNNANAHSWEQLQAVFPTLRDNEIRLMYKIVFEYRSSYDLACKKTVIRTIDDLRKQKITTTALAGGTLPATSITFAPIGNLSSTNVQNAIQELDDEKLATVVTDTTLTGNGTTASPLSQNTTNSVIVPTTTDIIPDFSSDIYLISNTRAASETAVSNSTYVNMPTRTGFKTVRFYNAFTATRTLTLYGTATLILGGITYTFQYINSNIIAVPTLKTLEISYEFIFTSSTACTVSIISALQL